MQIFSVTSHQRNSARAIQEAVASISARVTDPADSPDLVLFFTTPAHASAARGIATLLRETWPDAMVLGTTAASVLHSGGRPGIRPALSLFAASLPEVMLAPIRMDLPDFEETPVCLENWEDLLQLMPDPELVILLADPFTTPMGEILESLATLAPSVPVVGGLSSGARRPGANVLVLNEERHRSGLIGVALSGNVRADVLVSQGCRPVGDVFTVTKAEGNILLELSGVPAIEALQEMVSGLPTEDRQLLQEGLMLGQAVDDPSDSFGRGDFLIRPVVAVDQKGGTISVAGHAIEGQMIRFHVWDDTLAEDLEMLLLPQTLDTPASGGLLFGSWPRRPAETRPRFPLGQIRRVLGYPMPMAGFYSAGELGPIRGVNYLHMHAAAFALLRPAREERPESNRPQGRLN